MEGRLFREPDERSGPALMGREPILLTDMRKEMADKVRERL